MTIVEFIEKDCGIELFDWQKKLLNERAKEGKSFKASVIRKGCVVDISLQGLSVNQEEVCERMSENLGKCLLVSNVKNAENSMKPTESTYVEK